MLSLRLCRCRQSFLVTLNPQACRNGVDPETRSQVLWISSEWVQRQPALNEAGQEVLQTLPPDRIRPRIPLSEVPFNTLALGFEDSWSIWRGLSLPPRAA